jgi:hypothetical protein
MLLALRRAIIRTDRMRAACAELAVATAKYTMPPLVALSSRTCMRSAKDETLMDLQV